MGTHLVGNGFAARGQGRRLRVKGVPTRRPRTSSTSLSAFEEQRSTGGSRPGFPRGCGVFWPVFSGPSFLRFLRNSMGGFEELRYTLLYEWSRVLEKNEAFDFQRFYHRGMS